jgi:hypothetical protein
MTPKDWFAVGIRILGVVILIYGIWDLVNAGLLHYEYWKNPDTSSGYYVIVGCATIIMGLYLAAGASHLVNFAYPDEKEANGEEPDAAGEKDRIE